DGGGADVAGTATITDCTFVADRAVGDAAFGGGLDLLGIATLAGDVFKDNHLAPAQPAYDTDGAGLYAAGPVTVTRSTFVGNDATGRYAYGGGASSEGGFVLTDSTLSANVALGSAGGYGGGLYAEGGATVTATTFERNLAESATESFGGGLYVQDSTSVLDSVFRANTATNGTGGGVFAAGVGTYLEDATFTRNHATGGDLAVPGGPGYGGAIAADSATRVVGATIVGNLADRGGGGLFVGAPVELDHSLVAHNVAIEGGGVDDYWLLSGTADAIVDNTSAGAKGGGGGVFVIGATGLGDVHSVDLADSTIAGNVAGVGGGVEFQGGAGGSGGGSFLDDVVAGNVTGRGVRAECAFVGPLARRPISLGGNVVGDASCELRGSTDRPGPAAQGVWAATTAGVLLGRGVPTARTSGHVTGLAEAPGGQGCLVLESSGQVRGVGSARARWSAQGRLGGGSAVGIAVTPDGRGAWVASSDGDVVALGDAPALGGAPGAHVVAIAASVDGRGYELLERDGRVLALGDAPRLASRRGIDAVSLAMTPDGQGYWELFADGHVAASGDARSFGPGPRDALAILSSPDGRGYLVVTSRGAVAVRGDAHDPGPLRGRLVAAAAT
ncbi:MAG TPA: right-handed parallel beta-helix repeat-containing protein, partial [Acidimicrobiales bacterium]|nr:right-handed parallel beta-helix repeat-containing protein [Acidimicrobiales bacterium]